MEELHSVADHHTGRPAPGLTTSLRLEISAQHHELCLEAKEDGRQLSNQEEIITVITVRCIIIICGVCCATPVEILVHALLGTCHSLDVKQGQKSKSRC